MRVDRVRYGLHVLEIVFERVYLKINVDFSVPILAIIKNGTARNRL